jgi:succinate dehydrogenase hydrophobic anchor subunit
MRIAKFLDARPVLSLTIIMISGIGLAACVILGTWSRLSALPAPSPQVWRITAADHAFVGTNLVALLYKAELHTTNGLVVIYGPRIIEELP